jgi:glutathione S-transferase
MADIKLYQFGPVLGRESASPFCVKIHYAFRYKRIPFDVVNLNTPTQVKKYNSRGKLPVAAYDGRLIADSSEIIRLLEEQHREPRLYPENERQRSYALLLEDWADESLYWHVVYENWLVDDQYDKFAPEILSSIPSLLRPVIKIIARRQTRANLNGQGLGRVSLPEHRAKLGQCLDWLNSLCDGEFLCGKDLSVADIAVAAQATSLLSPITPYTAGEIRKRSRLLGWYERTITAVA